MLKNIQIWYTGDAFPPIHIVVPSQEQGLVLGMVPIDG